MTGSNKKLRALILSALMVLSVFAGTIALGGTAAAAANADVASVTEYSDGDIEVALTQSATLDNYTVYVDGAQVASSSTAQGPSANFNLTGVATDLKPSQDVVINLGISDSGGETWANFTVQSTSQTVDLGSGTVTTTAVYSGEPIAVTTAGVNQGFDVNEDGSWVATKSTGTNSRVFVYDTGSVEPGTNVTLDPNEGSNNKQHLDVRELGLANDAASTSLTTNDAVAGTVSSNVAARTVDLALMNEDGAVVAVQKGKTLDNNGELDYSFGTQSAGNYTVVATDVETANSASTDTITVSQVTADATFESSVVSEEQGDIATITVLLSGGADEINVTVGNDDVNFNTTIHAVDSDGDGVIVINWNTAASFTGDAGFSVTNGTLGSAGVTVNDGVSDVVDTGEYPVAVSVSGVGETDLATVILEERSNVGLTTHTAPDGTTGADAVAAASSAETGNTIAVAASGSDTVILRLSATGLEGNVSSAKDLIPGGNFSVSLTQTSDTVATNEDPISLNASSMTLVKTSEEDVYYLVFDSKALVTAAGGPSEAIGDKYTVAFDDPATPDVAADLSASFQLIEGKTSFDTEAGQLFLPPNSDAEVTGTSTWAPGSELQVTLKSSGGTAPFVKTNKGIVLGSDQTWSTTFDLSEQPEGQDFEASLVSNSKRVTVTGTIGSLSASISMQDQEAMDSGTLVEVSVGELSNGGFIAIHLESASGKVIGNSDYIAPGESGTVQIRLKEAISGQTTLVAMAHKDTDQDKTYDFGASEGEDDGPYLTSGGDPVVSSAVVTLPSDTTEPPEETTEPPADTTEPPADTTEPPEEPEDTPTTTPGFGLIVALLALAGAALLARRRE